jgi:V8-like Glu-specific endopeptidase
MKLSRAKPNRTRGIWNLWKAAVVFLSSAVTVIGCATTELPDSNDAPIVGGIETDAYPAIGFLAAYGEGDGMRIESSSRCTGSLIAPDVVLTAAHCLGSIAPWWKNKGYTYKGLFFGVGLEGAEATVYEVKEEQSHPEHTKYVRHDIGYVILKTPVRGITPLKVRRTAATASCNYVATGYGIATPGYSAHSRRTAAVTTGRKALNVCAHLQNEDVIAVSSSHGEVCNGDSGGPLRIRGTRYIVGVLGQGEGKPCQSNNVDFYAPISKNLEFVDRALAASRFTH